MPPAAIKSGELLRILKNVYGLTENPRLWYLEALDRMKKTDFQELEISRSTFITGGGNNGSTTYTIFYFHMDNGLLLGNLYHK